VFDLFYFIYLSFLKQPSTPSFKMQIGVGLVLELLDSVYRTRKKSSFFPPNNK